MKNKLIEEFNRIYREEYKRVIREIVKRLQYRYRNNRSMAQIKAWEIRKKKYGPSGM